eukprot:2868368-Pleurochrysis_carterae.AAC.5
MNTPGERRRAWSSCVGLNYKLGPRAALNGFSVLCSVNYLFPGEQLVLTIRQNSLLQVDFQETAALCALLQVDWCYSEYL